MLGKSERLSKKDPHEESENEGKKSIEKTQKPKDEEKHVDSTLHTGNRQKISIEEFSWTTEDNRSTLNTQETEQQKLVYITNLKDDLQKNNTKLFKEEDPKSKKPTFKNRPFERPSLVNLIHVSEYMENLVVKIRTLK